MPFRARNRGLLRAGNGLNPPSGFNASAWTNLLFWNDVSDASTVSESSNNILEIRDKSGNGYDLDTVFGTVTINSFSLNGRRMMTWTGNASNAIAAGTNYTLTTSAITMFAVYVPTNLSQVSQGLLNPRIAGQDDLQSLLMEVRDSRLALTYGRGVNGGVTTYNANHTAAGVLVVGTPYVIAMRMDNITGPGLHVNGNAVSLSNFSGSLAIGNFLVSAKGPCSTHVGIRQSTFPLFGHVGDVIGYSERKNDATTVAISQGLMTKWGIS